MTEYKTPDTNLVEIRWCAMCQCAMIICPRCGNPTCNGTYGENGECPICPKVEEIHKEMYKNGIMNKIEEIIPEKKSSEDAWNDWRKSLKEYEKMEEEDRKKYIEENERFWKRWEGKNENK